MASAYGTRGLVLRDQGRDEEAVEFFKRSYAERTNTPSPNLESMKENLEEEIAALKRLGRREDAVVAEGRLAQVSAQRSEIPNVDVGLSSHVSQAKGSVLVEIPFGSRPGNRYSIKDTAKLAVELADAAKSQNAGFCAGTVTIPESTTLMFYGEDAEALYQIDAADSGQRAHLRKRHGDGPARQGRERDCHVGAGNVTRVATLYPSA